MEFQLLTTSAGSTGRCNTSKLPYADTSLDRVLSSFMFHHIRGQDREKTLDEVRRVLKPGGSLHLVDFRGAENQEENWLGRRIHSSHRLSGNSADQILALMNNAGLKDSRKVAEGAMLLGHVHIAYYRASSPSI